MKDWTIFKDNCWFIEKKDKKFFIIKKIGGQWQIQTIEEVGEIMKNYPSSYWLTENSFSYLEKGYSQLNVHFIKIEDKKNFFPIFVWFIEETLIFKFKKFFPLIILKEKEISFLLEILSFLKFNSKNLGFIFFIDSAEGKYKFLSLFEKEGIKTSEKIISNNELAAFQISLKKESFQWVSYNWLLPTWVIPMHTFYHIKMLLEIRALNPYLLSQNWEKIQERIEEQKKSSSHLIITINEESLAFLDKYQSIHDTYKKIIYWKKLPWLISPGMIANKLIYIQKHKNLFFPDKIKEFISSTASSGGYNVLFKPYGKKLYHYDQRSQYPWILCEKIFMGGNPLIWNKKEKGEIQNLPWGFYRVKVKSYPNHKIEKNKIHYAPILSCHGPFYPIGEWEHIYFSEELKYADSTGFYDLEILEGYYFKENCEQYSWFQALKLMIQRLFKKKELNKKEREGIKLLINSITGSLRSFSRPTFVGDLSHLELNSFNKEWKKIGFPLSELALDLTQKRSLIKGVLFFPYDIETKEQKAALEKIQTLAILKKWQTKNWNIREDRPCNIQINAAITAYSRIHLHQIMNKIGWEHLYYCDTDGFFSSSPLSSNFLTSKMGGWKLEGEWDEGLFLVRKKYHLMKTKSKIGRIYNDHEQKPNVLSYSDKEATNKRDIFKGGALEWSLNSAENFQKTKENYFTNWNPKSSLSREKIYSKDQFWIDTKPLFFDWKNPPSFFKATDRPKVRYNPYIKELWPPSIWNGKIQYYEEDYKEMWKDLDLEDMT